MVFPSVYKLSTQEVASQLDVSVQNKESQFRKSDLPNRNSKSENLESKHKMFSSALANKSRY